MFHTSKLAFGLRTISLLGGEIIILKAVPISDKTARYVRSQERAIIQTISRFGVIYSHTLMYKIIDQKGLIEAVYRSNYR